MNAMAFHISTFAKELFLFGPSSYGRFTRQGWGAGFFPLGLAQ
jgi:hypothetical protein